jgi:hypothetical protein
VAESLLADKESLRVTLESFSEPVESFMSLEESAVFATGLLSFFLTQPLMLIKKLSRRAITRFKVIFCITAPISGLEGMR